MVAITTKEAKEKILAFIIGGQIATAEWTYAPDRAVITISNFVRQIEGLTKYRARLALRELIAEGLICYTSQGNPAVVSYGEVPELVYDAAPPTNGYALTEKGYKSDKYKTAYGAWCKSLEEWANGDYNKEDDSWME